MEDKFDHKMGYIVHQLDNDTFIFKSENEDERNKLLNQVENVIKKLEEKEPNKQLTTNLKRTPKNRSTNNIRKHINEFLEDCKLKRKSIRTISDYKKKSEFLLSFLQHKKIFSLKDIEKKDVFELQEYLLKYPRNSKKYEEIKNENIFELIDKKSKLLDKFDKMDFRTVDNYITKFKTIFSFFEDRDYIYKNYFLNIKNLKSKNNNAITQFQQNEDTYIQFEQEEIIKLINECDNVDLINLMVLSLITGMRQGEISNLKKYHINLYHDHFFIDIKQSKTSSGLREIPINRNFYSFIFNLIKDKKDDDYLIFEKDTKSNRLDVVSKRINYYITKKLKYNEYLKEKNKLKVFHSFRKNFVQLCYLYKLEELYIKILVGHSLRDITFSTYNLSRVDKMNLIEQVNLIQFDFLKHIDNDKITKNPSCNFNPLKIKL
ncbi:tyrosine-type recombinase/integrase [Aliarcobacter butzleri]|uniref:tyrosine-type recombinase/integrase n=1 Tax=Aliarcobacter butzleri TaxID=28197 RepID=UPI0012609685|nr:tyrosine-type recombinase/integrase [Aliarcobacter butzleri]